MPPVFAHGRLRLYLLKLLDEAPRHGYEVIRLLEERFQGLYAPSAGTVYPRLAKLEAEGLVTHATEGGRKVYSITDAGRAELADRGGELADLELEIRDSVCRARRRDPRRRPGRGGRAAPRDAGGGRPSARPGQVAARTVGQERPRGLFDGVSGDKEAWRQAKEELRKAKQEWKEQARRAKDESRRAREEAQQARRQAKEAQEQGPGADAATPPGQVQDHFARGDWPTGVREGLAEITGQPRQLRAGTGAWPLVHQPAHRRSRTSSGPPDADGHGRPRPGTWTACWTASATTSATRPGTTGVTEDQLREARRHLATAAATSRPCCARGRR